LRLADLEQVMDTLAGEAGWWWKRLASWSTQVWFMIQSDQATGS
jgi:hypothetical protein